MRPRHSYFQDIDNQAEIHTVIVVIRMDAALDRPRIRLCTLTQWRECQSWYRSKFSMQCGVTTSLKF